MALAAVARRHCHELGEVVDVWRGELGGVCILRERS